MTDLPPVPPAASVAAPKAIKTVITPVVRHGAPPVIQEALNKAAAAINQASAATAFDDIPATVKEARQKAAHVRAALSNAVKAVDAAVKAALSLDELASDPKAAQALSLEGLDADTLKRFNKAAQPLLAYLTPPQPETPPATP